MKKELKKRADELLAKCEQAKETNNWDFLKNFDVKTLANDLETAWSRAYQTKSTNMLYDYYTKVDGIKHVKQYLASEPRFKKLYPEWFKARGNKINEYLFSHLDKFKFRKKFFRPPTLNDVYVKWLFALQMLGCAVWKDITSMSGETRDGMCQELDYRESMLGAGWMEIVGEEKHKGKIRPIYSITDLGANVIQYCAEH